MKLKLTFLIFVLGMNAAQADSFQGKVDAIEKGEGDQPHIIKLDNARVVFLDGEEKEELPLFEESLASQESLEIVVDKDYSYESAQTVEVEEVPAQISEASELKMSYDPTVIPDTTTANDMFRRMRRDYQNDSQCYNRAHIWAYEEYKTSGLNSMKLFLFFTNRYIRNYRYKWWFHVSPMNQVQTADSSGERVFDRRYTSGTRTLKNWTDNFIASRRTCPKVERYNDYRNNQESEDCYLIPVSMYFWQPRDILRRDQTGYIKTQFFNSEVSHAYWEAF